MRRTKRLQNELHEDEAVWIACDEKEVSFIFGARRSLYDGNYNNMEVFKFYANIKFVWQLYYYYLEKITTLYKSI